MKNRFYALLAFSCFVAGANAQSNCNSKVYSQGSATYYTLLDDAAGTARSGNCSFVNSDIKPYYGAMYTPIYDNSNYCGVCVEVTGKKGTQIIQIVDQCPSCHVDGDIDLSPAAFQIIVGDLSIGKSPISWKAVACPLAGKNIRVSTQGSNQWYAKVIIEQHVNKIKAVEIYNSSSWKSLVREADNGWTTSGVSIPGNTQVRITDIFNEQLVVDGVEIASGTNKTFMGTSNFKPCITTSLDDLSAVRTIQIYPNPASDLILIDDTEGIQLVNVYNTLGELVMTKQVDPSQHKLMMDISTLGTGIYTLHFTTRTHVQAIKKVAKL
jgi:expansin (peptidoglycan-binding protein)